MWLTDLLKDVLALDEPLLEVRLHGARLHAAKTRQLLLASVRILSLKCESCEVAGEVKSHTHIFIVAMQHTETDTVVCC